MADLAFGKLGAGEGRDVWVGRLGEWSGRGVCLGGGGSGYVGYWVLGPGAEDAGWWERGWEVGRGGLGCFGEGI